MFRLDRRLVSLGRFRSARFASVAFAPTVVRAAPVAAPTRLARDAWSGDQYLVEVPPDAHRHRSPSAPSFPPSPPLPPLAPPPSAVIAPQAAMVPEDANQSVSQKRAQRIRAHTVVAPSMSERFDGLQYSAHTAGSLLRRELHTIFPEAPRDAADLTVIVTMQRCDTPLMSFGAAQAAEKDRHLQRFFEWARAVRDALHAGHAERDERPWVEAADPASGLAAWGRGTGVYAEVDGAARLLGYATDAVGGCAVVRHPQWGLSVYLATMFTTARPDAVGSALQCVNHP